MKKEDVKRFLKLPCPEVIRLYISYGNLTHKEEEAIVLCIQRDYTQEQACEKLRCSEDSIHNWCKTGMEKLALAWDGNFVVKKLLE